MEHRKQRPRTAPHRAEDTQRTRIFETAEASWKTNSQGGWPRGMSSSPVQCCCDKSWTQKFFFLVSHEAWSFSISDLTLPGRQCDAQGLGTGKSAISSWSWSPPAVAPEPLWHRNSLADGHAVWQAWGRLFPWSCPNKPHTWCHAQLFEERFPPGGNPSLDYWSQTCANKVKQSWTHNSHFCRIKSFWWLINYIFHIHFYSTDQDRSRYTHQSRL